MDTRTFSGVSEEMWEKLKSDGRERHGIEIEGDGEKGTLRTPTPIGSIVLEYDYDAAASTITYGIVQKPFLVSSGQIWSGIEGAIDDIRET